MPKKITTKDFIKKAKKIHKDDYDYSKAEYVNNHTKICIICPIHGEFWQLPSNHIHKTHPRGCPKCNGGVPLTSKEFVKAAKNVHGNDYDYSKVDLEHRDEKGRVCIICPIHGEFWQLPSNHIHKTHPRGCPKCNGGVSITMDEFLEKSHKKHGNDYDYSKVDLEHRDEKGRVCIICKKHGEFWQHPSRHMNGAKCAYCARVGKLNTEEFKRRGREIHGDKYIYTKSEYKTQGDLITVTCPIHGDFTQTANSHLHGAGCPHCRMSHLELVIKKLLDDSNIEYVHVASKKDLNWLGKYSLDFYLPKYNIAIECQGVQHFKKISFFEKSKYGFDYTVKNDKIKNELCEKNGIKILYYSDLGIEYPYYVFEDKKQLLNEILKNGSNL